MMMAGEDDEQEYGEEMVEGQGMQISNALAGQRASKKRAQDDVKLLANRIALLKLEEKKVSQTALNAVLTTCVATILNCVFALSFRNVPVIFQNQFHFCRHGKKSRILRRKPSIL